MATTSADEYTFEAIGTQWWLERLDGDEFTEDIKEALVAYTTQFDQRYSRFRDDSLVARLAKTGVLNNPPQQMLDLLRVAGEFTEATDGTFSLFTGNTLQNLGYGINSPKKLKRFNLFRKVWTDEKKVRVEKGVVLDFGGLGKGWLIDEYVKILRQHGVKEFIVNGGGDLYVDASGPISFALEHPYDASQMIGNIRIQKGALAASSTVKRSWSNGSGTHHHIIDPLTHESSKSDAVATFVCAHTATIADSLATVLIVRPSLKKKLEQTYNVEALVLTKDQLG